MTSEATIDAADICERTTEKRSVNMPTDLSLQIVECEVPITVCINCPSGDSDAVLEEDKDGRGGQGVDIGSATSVMDGVASSLLAKSQLTAPN